MAVTLAAAWRLGALHHRLEPAGHVHLQHLIAADETVLLREGEGRRRGEREVVSVHMNEAIPVKPKENL